MYSFEWMIGVALVALAGGLGLGALLGQSMASSRKVKSLQEELEAAREAHSDYRAEVYDQFSETARKFERLNESYRDLHQQLASSAVALLGDAAVQPLLKGPDASDQIIDADVTGIPEAASATAGDVSDDTGDDVDSTESNPAHSPETPSANETELAATRPATAEAPEADPVPEAEPHKPSEAATSGPSVGAEGEPDKDLRAAAGGSQMAGLKA